MTVPAYAGATADGASADSPGVISGNTVQLPVHVPVNVCGNTVNVVGLLNPAVGNSCSNQSAGGRHTAGGSSTGGSAAHGSGKDSPGVISGNTIQLPVHAPVNVSGNTADVVGIGDAAEGNRSANASGGHTHHCTKPAPVRAHPQPATARHAAPRQAPASLAHTGTDPALPAAVASAALVLGGAALRRRFRPRPQR
ncbi:LAXTG-anchored chaplin ChpB [Streptomyces longisporus]|uniref:LAXTG-anchored chaplin ChpB n=1 Tax=Streptomyces longisporus TaxID=1948 RepID=A0ABP5Y416_STRLO